MCVLPLSKIKFGIRSTIFPSPSQRSSHDATERYNTHLDMIYAQNRGGVTIGQVIDAIHEHLLKKIGQQT